MALEKHILALDTYYDEYPSLERPETIYIEQNNLVSEWPSSLDGKQLCILTSQNWSDIYKENGKKLTQLRIHPIDIESNLIKITLTPYRGTMRKKNHLELGLSDWTRVYFAFNEDIECWEVDRVEGGGI